MINKPLNEITKDDLQWLIDNQIPEDKTTEYKSKLEISNDENKRKLLERITAFANADGGDLIYGIKEDENKLPAEIVGVIRASEYDQTIQTITNIMSVKIRPRINDIDFAKVDLGNEDVAVIIRIRSSIFSPHAVFDGVKHSFHIRKSNTTFHMDVDELRNSFLKTENQSKRIREFIADRLVEIDANHYDYLNKEFPILVIHAIPITLFLRRENFAVKEINDAVRISGSDAFNRFCIQRVSFDGVRITNTKTTSGNQSFAFYFLDGTVEVAGNNDFFYISEDTGSISCGTKMIRSQILCSSIIKCITQIQEYYSVLQVKDSILIFISVLNARGYHMYNGRFGDYDSMAQAIDRDVVVLPETYIEQFSLLNQSDIPKTLRPLLDSLWNASGHDRCYLYNDQGDIKNLDRY